MMFTFSKTRRMAAMGLAPPININQGSLIGKNEIELYNCTVVAYQNCLKYFY